MEKLIVRYVLLVLFGCYGVIYGQEPCTDYTLVHENYKRSVGYMFNSALEQPGNDRYITASWYRYTGPQGEDMVTTSPGLNRCGTVFPIWLNGALPSVADGVVDATACVVGFTQDCAHSFTIKIKNCGEYRVYYHIPTPGDDEVYCIGTEIPCPPGTTSPNGYTPGCHVDPCDANRHTVVDEDYKRSSAYPATVPFKTDRYLAEGWYRYTGRQGEDMITASPGLNKCGTTFPIWLNGAIPTVDQGIVTRQACVMGFGTDCDHTYDIPIKNCGAFRVYYFKPTDGTDEVYCIGSEVPCPANNYSPNGYTPGCQEDVDECLDNNGGCDQGCTNVLGFTGSYQCDCSAGYELNADQHTCDDINECTDGNNGGCQQVCTNIDGSYECGCNPGYQLTGDSHSCVDIDECGMNNGGCDDTCENTDGSYICSCGAGYTLNADGHTCDDIDECADNNGGCSQQCHNTGGSYECGCNPGYMLNVDGYTCDDINECDTNNGGCDHECANVPGSYLCACDVGYKLRNNGHQCIDIIECDKNNGGCEQTCSNSPGSYSCSCNGGYILNVDGHSCDDINECDSKNGGCDHHCANTAGSYLCSCNNGFKLNADGHACSDINECSDKNGGCSDSCVNTQGSYNCECSPGNRMLDDGHTCVVQKPEIGETLLFWSVHEDSFFRSVVFKCSLASVPDDLIYKVTWSFGGKEVFSQSGLSSESFPVELHEDQWDKQSQVQDNLRCEVSAQRYNNWLPSDISGKDYFVGFKVDTPVLKLEEGGAPVYYIIIPTVPILCPRGYEHCTLPLEVHTPVSKNDKSMFASCPSGSGLEQGALEFVQTPCRVDIPMTTEITPNTSFSIVVTAALDNVYDGEHKMAIRVEGPAVYQYHKLLSGVVLPEVEVIITDKDVDLAKSVCKARNDPHMTTFDGRVFENQLEGEFIMYQHTSLPIEVRGYFKKCNGYATCVCGVAIRSGADLFIYDSCRIFLSRPLRVRMYSCKDESITVKQITSSRYRIVLPTGTEVLVDRSWIQIRPSVADIGKVQGLCGTLDNDCSNDFLMQNGEYSSHSKAGNTNCDSRNGWDRYFHPTDFSASWRVNIFKSWYSGILPDSDNDGLEKVVYCSCPNGGTDAVCSDRPVGSSSIQNCISNDYDNNPLKRCVSRSKRDASSADDVEDEVGNFEFDPDFVAQSAPDFPVSGWTEAAAVDNCTKEIKGRTVLLEGEKLGVVDLNSYTQTCVADIQLTGTTAYTSVHLQDATEDVYREVSKNMTLYTFDPDTGLVKPPALLSQICPNDCSGHGTCVNGVCECFANYGDTDCQLKTNNVPVLYDMPTNGLCDLQSRPCQATPVTGNYFVQSTNLKCKVTPVLSQNGEQVNQHSVVTQADYDHLNRAICPFPTLDTGLDDGATSYSFQVAMTNDGENYSESKSVTVYDGRCVECPTGSNGFCTLMPGNCYIERTCFTANQLNPLDKCKTCDPNYSTQGWTPVLADGCENQDYTFIIVGAVLAVILASIIGIIGFIAYKFHIAKKVRRVDDISKVDLKVDA